MELYEMHCSPVSRGASPLAEDKIKRLLERVGKGWSVESNRLIRKQFTFESYMEGISFVHHVADLAEAENHHPDMRVSYGTVTVELSTHDVGGLSENDFILAAKIENL